MDCFYAQVMEKKYPQYKGKPLAIQQKYIIVTCNYIARDFGLQKLMLIERAKKLCPELVVVDGSDLRPFRAASEDINGLWLTYSDLVERKGMDESFVDITKIVNKRMLHNNNSNKFEGHIVGDISSSSDINREEEKMRFQIGTQIMKEMRQDLFEKLGFKCTGGLSCSKLGAKLAGELHKPNQQTCILPWELPNFIKSQQMCKIQGVGRKQLQKLLDLYLEMVEDPLTCKIQQRNDLKCKDILPIKLKVLENHFGTGIGKFIYDAVRGIDLSPVKPSGLVKTISQEETALPHPSTKEAASQRLYGLCERLLEFILKRQEKENQLPTTIRVSITDKGDNVKAKRSERVHKSAQKKVAAACLKESKTFHRTVEPLLYSLLPTQKPFLLCRINLAASEFEKSTCTTGSINTLKNCFQKVVHNNNSKIDQSVFDQLPKDIQEEIIGKKRPATKTTIDSFFTKKSGEKRQKQIDDSVFQSLPPEIQREIQTNKDYFIS